MKIEQLLIRQILSEQKKSKIEGAEMRKLFLLQLQYIELLQKEIEETIGWECLSRVKPAWYQESEELKTKMNRLAMKLS